MRITNILLAIFLLLVLTQSVFAYNIVGNSVIEEDNASKLLVSPYLVGKNHDDMRDLEQDFSLTNKTMQSQPVYLLYMYNKPLQSGKVFTKTPAVYGYVENQSYVCAPPLKYTYVLNRYPDQPNNNFLHCYKTNDNNTPANTTDDFNQTVNDVNFSRGDIPTNTVYIKNYGVTVPEIENDYSNLFSYAAINGKSFYYLANPITFNAGETKSWTLRYTPNAEDETGKWALAYYTGASATCILDNTCTYMNILDPWWTDLAFDQNTVDNFNSGLGAWTQRYGTVTNTSNAL